MTQSPISARAPRLRGARALFTGRAGGVSAAPFDSLNLARHVGDDPEAVETNRALLAREIGLPLVFVEQVHSADVLVLRSGGARGEESSIATADALVTDRTDIALAIMVADCVPVLLSDPVAGVIGAAHAGRRGLLGGVLEATAAAMAALGADPARTEAAIGPAVCGRCYEVPEAMQEEAVAALPAARSTTRSGTPALDLPAGTAAALVRAGLAPERIDAGAPCTLEDERWFSYRRSARTGRFVGAIRRAGT